MSSLIDLSRLTKRDYTVFGLKRNPFPSLAIPEEYDLITVDRETIIKHFQDMIASLYTDESSSITVVAGGYGSGKSHLLKIFKFNVKNQLQDLSPGTICFYINSPGRNFLDFYLAIIDDFGQDMAQKISEILIKKFIDNITDLNKYYFRKGVQLTNLNNLYSEVRIYDFLNGFKKYYKELENSDLLTAFFFISQEQYSNLAWRWLNGEKLNSEEKKYLKISTDINDTRIAYDYFKSFRKICEYVNLTKNVILVDELEKILLCGFS